MGEVGWWLLGLSQSHPSGLSLRSGPPPSWPPGEGLSADNQGTDSERKRKKSTQAPDRILIFRDGMSAAAAVGQGVLLQAQHLQPERVEGTPLDPGEMGEGWLVLD